MGLQMTNTLDAGLFPSGCATLAQRIQKAGSLAPAIPPCTAKG
jgi:hypothetical protein